MTNIKRLRIFAGPNGSGKSTLVKVVEESNIHLGLYINADEIQVYFDRNKFLNFDDWNIILDITDLKTKIESSLLYNRIGGISLLSSLYTENNLLKVYDETAIGDYFISFLADYIRNILVSTCNKFSFETVMSHSSKLDFMRKAKDRGYKIYLYFVSLDNVQLNIGRVATRVQQGGHNVPIAKITERYLRSMNLLLDAIKIADKSFIFDNSYSELNMFATVGSDRIRIEDANFIPLWFQVYVLDKLE